jgi:hypothetical protein
MNFPRSAAYVKEFFLMLKYSSQLFKNFTIFLTEAAPATATSSASAPAPPVIDKESLETLVQEAVKKGRGSPPY